MKLLTSSSPAPALPLPRRALPALAVWAAAWAAMFLLDGWVDLANLAMLLVLASALAALFLSAVEAIASNAVAVLAFNWFFVPPRGSFDIHLRQHALLLGAMLLVSALVATLVARQRSQAGRARRLAHRADDLRALVEALRDADEPQDCAAQLAAALERLSAGAARLIMLDAPLPSLNDMSAVRTHGQADAEELEAMWACLRQGVAFGPGSGRHEVFGAWVLPMRGRQGSLGAALLPLDERERRRVSEDDAQRMHAQALCDQMGLSIERALGARAAQRADANAQTQGVRNALLAAISHDYRTPLASIMGSASSLRDQAERMDLAQRKRLASRIVEEVEQLERLTSNTLQLARLDAPGVALRMDWESAEEIVGAALARARRRDSEHAVRARIEPGLPLLRCDALLLAQLLDNLVDNAIKYSDAGTPVEILARRHGEHAVLAVRDRGPGVDLAWRDRIFDVFQRGHDDAAASRRGAGVGLAVCRAIAQAHGGELRLRSRAHGGSSFECWLPLVESPVLAPEAQADTH